MRSTIGVAAVLILSMFLGVAHAQEGTSPSLMSPTNETVRWDQWVSAHQGGVIVFWASWLPPERRDPTILDRIQREAADLNLAFTIVAVQEPIDDSRKVLNPSGFPWLHDRHGALLKHLRVFRIPAITVVDGEGNVLATLPFVSGTLRDWGTPQ